MTVAAGLSPFRVLACLLTLCGLGLSGWTAYGHSAQAARPKPPHEGELRLARLELDAAAGTLERAHDLIGSYAETDLNPYRRLVLVRATDVDYCIQVVGPEGGVYRLAGPNGRAEPGLCPRT